MGIIRKAVASMGRRGMPAIAARLLQGFPRGNSRAIQRAEASERIIGEFGTKGSPLTNVLPTVQPVAIVSDLSRGSDRDFAVTRWARGRGSTPAGVAFGKLSFNNPAGSGILVRIYQVDVFHSGMAGGAPLLHPSGLYAGGIIGIGTEAASGFGTQINFTKQYVDRRLELSRLPTVDIRYDNSGGLAGHVIRPWVPVTGWHANFHGWVLAPNSRLHFEGLDVNTEFNASVEWTETALE